MNVYWLEQRQVDVPQHDDWLSPFEKNCLSRMPVPKRRNDWRLGRWTAKRAVAASSGLPAHPRVLATIEIRAAQSGAPEVFVNNHPVGTTISLSHRAGVGLCAVAPGGVALGCDLELIEPHSPAFVADYFTDEEQALIAQAPDADRLPLLALLWSAKESALKALHEGLRLDTRWVTVAIAAPLYLCGWSPLQVRYRHERAFHGWWRRAGQMVCTVVAEPAAEAPIAMAIETAFTNSPFQCA